MALTAIDPDGVLAMSAATLATSLRVEEDAVAVQEQIDGVAGLVGHRIDIRTRTSTLAGDLAELAGWAREIVLRYVDDEKPINDLMTMGFWMPDFSKLGWDGELSAGENVDKTVRSDEFGAFVLGTSGMLLDRYRRFSLYVPNRNGPVPLPPLQLPAPDDFVHGRPLVQLPSGLFVPQGGSADPTVARLAAEADGPRFHKPGAVSFVDDIGYGRPPAWARVGGRVLGAAGGVLTVYDSYMTQWEHDEKYHPDWSTGQRVANAGYNAATEGGGAVLGGLAGAQIGATVGSFIPIPVVGTVGGAIVGGAIGAFVGSKAGKAVGTAVKEAAEAVADKAKDAWNSLFG